MFLSGNTGVDPGEFTIAQTTYLNSNTYKL